VESPWGKDAGLAHRVLRDEPEISRPILRHSWRRTRPHLPHHEMKSPSPRRHRNPCPVLDPQRVVNINKEKDVQVPWKYPYDQGDREKLASGGHPLFLLSQHYRSPVDFSEDSLSEAKSGLDGSYATNPGRPGEGGESSLPSNKVDPAVVATSARNMESFQVR